MKTTGSISASARFADFDRTSPGVRKVPILLQNPLAFLPKDDSVALMRFAVEAIDDGAVSITTKASFSCPLKPRCCPKAPERKIPRSIHEDARDVARALVGTAAFEQSRRNRKRVEMLFAHLKRILRLGRLRLRGPRGAQDEFTLGAIAQNLRRLAKLVARPPPAAELCSA